jgi:uncharacterized protein
MKLLAFNDIHTNLAGARKLVEMSREADVVIGAGDFCSVHKGLDEMIEVISHILKPTLLVAGNNETDVELRAACRAWPSARVLHGDGVAIDGVRFFGVGGAAPTPWEWSFDLEEAEFDAYFASCAAADVLVVHSPPWGVLDGSGAAHYGSKGVRRAIEMLSPRHVFCGHIHEFFGREENIGLSLVHNVGPGGRLFTI